MQVTPPHLVIILSRLRPLSRLIFLLVFLPVRAALADGLDRALEAGGGLQLQLVGHGVDLEPVQPGGRRQ